MESLELKIEKEKLSNTIEIIKDLLVSENDSLDDLYKNFVGDREKLWMLADMKKNHIVNLETAKDKPYFARIDFKSLKDGTIYSIYIGKNGIINNSEIIVTDWRAPISSLYYDAEMGYCSYEAPEGIISGEMKLKRQFDIEQGDLIEYFDVDLVSNDALLQEYLKSNNDSRLKSIVATIQKEQNDVIRKKIYDNLIIQGVAGSGKTTVALHRIAYLVYNYMKKIKQNQYLVIGPNPVFLKYIKSVLPELDVTGVNQNTYEQFALNYIGEDFNINPSDKKINASIAGKNKHDIDKFKCSKQYRDMLDAFLNVYFYGLTSNDLMIGEYSLISSDIIKKVFDSTQDSFRPDLKNRVELSIDRLCKYVEDNNDQLKSKYALYVHELFVNASTDEEKEKLRSLASKNRIEIEKNCRSIIRRYFSKAKVDSIKLYRTFISSISNFDLYNYKYLSQLKKETMQNLKNGSCDFEDLAALLYIKSAIMPNIRYRDIKHVVIDEAQDLGEFNFYSLKKCLPIATFSVFGDLAQSIYDYRGINNWNEVNDIMFDNDGEIINFSKSYRTTAEIMDVADDVAESINLGRSDLVVRHGEPVKLIESDSLEEIPNYIAKKIDGFKEKGYKTIAVVSKTDLLSRYINDDLADLGVHIPNVTANDDLTDEKFSVCTISNQLVKGLEFDAVIINNASEDIYSSNSSLDMKLLYVALTRALHELNIVYTGKVTAPLEKQIIKNKDNQLSLKR